MFCDDVIDLGCDAMTSMRHPFELDFGGGKSEKVHKLEVFCEVVRFATVDCDFQKRGCEVNSGN